MKNSNAKARMQDLFSSYHTILRGNGLGCIVKDNQKVAVSYVLSAIRPQTLKDRFESDLSFSQHSLRKYFPSFLAHAIKLKEAFQLVHSVPPSKRRLREDEKRSGNNSNGASSKLTTTTYFSKSNQKKNAADGHTRENVVPICLWEPHKKQGIRHLLKDCPYCPEAERHRILKDLANEKASTSARSTLSQTEDRTTGRLASEKSRHASISAVPCLGV